MGVQQLKNKKPTPAKTETDSKTAEDKSGKVINNSLWAVIIGGSSGLGLATAQKLAKHGMNICIVHRDRKSDLPVLEAEIAKMQALGVDVRCFNKDALLKENRDEIVGKLPDNSVKVLVHSVAKGSLKPLSGSKNDVLSKQDLDITLHAMGSSWYEWTRALIDNNKFGNAARNIAFTSEGNAKVWPGYAAVSAAKATLEALMRSMAVELAPLGITTNCIQAGATPTRSFKMIPKSKKLAKKARSRNPFKRLTTPEDVANGVYLLVQDEAGWINGAVLKVDGGESIR